MTGTTANNRKYLMSGAALLVVAAGAYGLGRVYPPLGPSAGTIAPSQRYQSPQVGEGDITLDALRAQQQRFARFGMKIISGVHYAYRSLKVQLGQPGRG